MKWEQLREVGPMKTYLVGRYTVTEIPSFPDPKQRFNIWINKRENNYLVAATREAVERLIRKENNKKRRARL